MEYSAHGLGFSSPIPHTRAVSGLCKGLFSAAPAYSRAHTSRLQDVAHSRLLHSSTHQQNCETFPDSSRHHCAPDSLFSLVSHRNRTSAILPLQTGLLMAASKPRSLGRTVKSQKKKQVPETVMENTRTSRGRRGDVSQMQRLNPRRSHTNHMREGHWFRHDWMLGSCQSAFSLVPQIYNKPPISWLVTSHSF